MLFSALITACVLGAGCETKELQSGFTSINGCLKAAEIELVRFVEENPKARVRRLFCTDERRVPHYTSRNMI